MELHTILRTCFHYSMHFLVPGLLAYFFYRARWKHAWLILLATMLVDVDHLLATPIFDSDRCSVGFHVLHSYEAIVVYALVFLFSKRDSNLQIVCVGLLFHMLTDVLDCHLGHL